MPVPSSLGRVAEVARAGEWWGHKLVSILCGFLLTLAMLGEAIAPHAIALVIVLAALVPGAAYVSIVNDVTDIAVDAAAGKPNRMAGRTPRVRAAAILASLSGGLVFAWIWRGEPALLACYAAAWLAFTFYSVPPIRLKGRGFAGVVADGAGAQLFPTLTAAVAAFAAAGAAPDPLWLAALGLWALGYGLRGNLCHQLGDREADLRSGVTTFAAGRHGAAAERLAVLAAFAAELAGLAVVLALLGWLLPIVGLALYGWLALQRAREWGVQSVVVAGAPGSHIVLQEYYDVFLPLALLAGTSTRHPADLAIAALLLLLFRQRFLQSWTAGRLLIMRPLFAWARRAAGRAARLAGIRRRPVTSVTGGATSADRPGD